MGLKQVVSVEPTASAFLGLQTCWESVGTKARLQQRAVTLGARLEQHALRALRKSVLVQLKLKLWKTTEVNSATRIFGWRIRPINMVVGQ